ncbi:hypothetical protein D3C87_1271590 [compost metagenome]
MVRAEHQRRLDVHHRVAGQHASLQRLLDALVHRRDELARHHAALDGVDEGIAAALRHRLEVEHHVAVLAAPARLLDELAFHVLGRTLDGLAVGHLRLADRGFHAKLALHPVHQDFQVQLAHARDDGLAGLLVGCHAERRVFLGQPVQGDAHLLLVGLGLRLHGLRDHRFREGHAFEDDDLVGVAQGVARGGLLEAHGRGDIAGAHFLDLVADVGVHLQDAPQPLALGLDRVVDRVARIHHARIHAEEDQLADERVGHDLEGERRERLLVVRVALGLLVVLGVAEDGGHVRRRRQVVDHRVQHRLHALVLERAAA